MQDAAQHVGWLSIIPPLLTIAMAFYSRKILPSLLVGIFSGSLIAAKWNPWEALVHSTTVIWKKTEIVNFATWESFNGSWNLFILLIVFIIGLFIGLLYCTGGAVAYGEWAQKRIKSRRGAAVSTMFLGFVIFFDDYFNCLTLGAVMRSVTDRFKIARAKLAYLIDSTAAPICILAPVSTWAIEVITQMRNSGVSTTYPGDPYQIFLSSLFLNSYAWLTLLMVFLVAYSQKDFGPMKRMEEGALAGDDQTIESGDEQTKVKKGYVQTETNKNAKIRDLAFPLAVFLGLIFSAMLYTGDFTLFGGKNGFVKALQNMHTLKAMFWGGMVGLGIIIVYFFARGLLGVSELFKTVGRSVVHMAPVATVLLLAWSLGSIIAEDLKTGLFVAELLTGNFPTFLLPIVVFAFSCLISFATGTSWGTFAIMIPITMPLAFTLAPDLLPAMLGALLGGAVYGDHTSPISDTTILSSIGAGSKHMDHVISQAAYGGLVAGICLVGYIIAGLLEDSGIMVQSVASLAWGVTALVVILKIYSRSPASVSSEATL